MRNRKDKIFALIAAGCLCLSGLTGCGEIKMSPDNISSKSDDGLMGSVKEETDTSDESEADAAGEEDKVSNDMIGRYVSQGYENPSFGFAIALPDTYTLEKRTNLELNADTIEASNADSTYDWIRSLIALGSATVFEAEDEDTYIELNIQNAAALDGATVWDEEKTIAENSVTTEEDIKEAVGEDAQITEFQNNVEEITFLGEKHYAAQYTFKNYDVPFYGVTVYLVNKQDPCLSVSCQYIRDPIWMRWIRRISFLVFIRSKRKGKRKDMKKCYVLFSLLMSTVVFTACGTGIKNSSGSSNSGSNSSVSMQTQNIEMEITDLVNLGSDPQAYMLYGSYRNEEEYKDEDGSYAEKHADDYDYMTLQLADSEEYEVQILPVELQADTDFLNWAVARKNRRRIER